MFISGPVVYGHIYPTPKSPAHHGRHRCSEMPGEKGSRRRAEEKPEPWGERSPKEEAP